MKRSEKIVLKWALGAVAGLLLWALGYAAVENVRAENARMKREEWEAFEARRVESMRKYEAQVAFYKTPEGKAQRAREEAHARAEAERMKKEQETRRLAEVREKMAEAARPSVWDGAVPAVVALVKAAANDPAGVTYNSWKTMNMGEDQQVTVVDFTVKNALGGPARHVWRVILDPRDGRVKGLHDGERWVVEPGK